MATLHELRSQIEQGKTAVLSYRDEDGEKVKTYVCIPTQGKYQGQYTRNASYTEHPNPFPEPQIENFLTWASLLTALSVTEAESEQWSLE
jgi:hypothetical protein